MEYKEISLDGEHWLDMIRQSNIEYCLKCFSSKLRDHTMSQYGASIICGDCNSYLDLNNRKFMSKEKLLKLRRDKKINDILNGSYINS